LGAGRLTFNFSTFTEDKAIRRKFSEESLYQTIWYKSDVGRQKINECLRIDKGLPALLLFISVGSSSASHSSRILDAD